MYLPSFYKNKNEKHLFSLMRFSKATPVLLMWFVWLSFPSLYNLVYTDIYPPAKGNNFS